MLLKVKYSRAREGEWQFLPRTSSGSSLPRGFMKILYYCLIILFLISMVSASNLECSLEPFYMKNGVQINVYSNDTFFDGIYFNVICSNNLERRISNLSIENASPIEFYNALPKNSIDFINIKNKLLYTSDIISVKDFGEISENFSVSIIGVGENLSIEKAEASKNIFIKNEEGYLLSIGKIVYPSYPTFGVIILFSLGILLIFFLWNYNVRDKLNLWKKVRMERKLEKNRQENLWN